MKTRTYESKVVMHPAAIGDGVNLTYRDVVRADGTVTSTVTGMCDGESVDTTETRDSGAIIDWDSVHSARLRSGWTLAGETP